MKFLIFILSLFSFTFAFAEKGEVWCEGINLGGDSIRFMIRPESKTIQFLQNPKGHLPPYIPVRTYNLSTLILSEKLLAAEGEIAGVNGSAKEKVSLNGAMRFITKEWGIKQVTYTAKAQLNTGETYEVDCNGTL